MKFPVDLATVRKTEKDGKTYYLINDVFKQLNVGTKNTWRHHANALTSPATRIETVKKRGQIDGVTGYFVPISVVYRAITLSVSVDAVRFSEYMFSLLPEDLWTK